MKDYAARKWFTSSLLITTQPCELLYAQAVSDGGEIKDTILYDGEDASGELIINLQRGEKGNVVLCPPEPIICYRGLYLTFGSSTEGILVLWRNLPRK